MTSPTFTLVFLDQPALLFCNECGNEIEDYFHVHQHEDGTFRLCDRCMPLPAPPAPKVSLSSLLALREAHQEAELTEAERLRLLPYPDYLQTEHWDTVRKATYRRAGYRCQLCGAHDVVLHAHHNTYANLGDEQPNDLIALCSDCHERFHDKAA